MANIRMDLDKPIKQELDQKYELDPLLKSEDIKSNPWLIENAKRFLKYCCPECEFNSKSIYDFSMHVSENHYTANMFYQSNTETFPKENIEKIFIHSLEKAEHGKCVVPNCDKQKSFRFFKFPKQQEKFDNWLTLCGLNTVKKEDRICADHFMKSDFCLRPSACPSLNLWSNDTQQYLMTETIQKKGNFYFFKLLTHTRVLLSRELDRYRVGHMIWAA